MFDVIFIIIIIIIHLVTTMTRYVQKAKPVGVQPKLQTKNNYLAIYTNKTQKNKKKQYTLTKQNNQLATPNKNEYN